MAKPIGLIAILALAIAFPRIFSNPAVLTVAIFTLLYATVTAAWNIFSGYTGYISLGHAAFFGIGSYALAIMCLDWQIPAGTIPFLLVPVAGLIAAIFSIPLGWISLRVRKHTFVVITVAIFFVMQPMAFNLRSITQGSIGISLPIPHWANNVPYHLPFYYVALIMLIIVQAVSWWIRNSKYGLGLLAIRDDEDRALGLGVNTGSAKLIAFVISAFFVGMVGALHAYFQGSIYPAFAFDPLLDIAMALMGFLGGLGTLSGPILGALLLEPTQRYFTMAFSDNGYYLIIYGAFFLAIILLLPEGVVPTLNKYWIKWNASRNGAAGQDGDVDANLQGSAQSQDEVKS
jgi:branched-chain amino acid transport system permease protein